MHRHSGPPSKGQIGAANTVYRHSGPLSKGQRGGANTVFRYSGPLFKGQSGSGRQYRHSEPLPTGQRGGGRQCTDTQDLYLNVRRELGTPCYTLTGLVSKGQRRGGNTMSTHRSDSSRVEHLPSMNQETTSWNDE